MLINHPPAHGPKFPPGTTRLLRCIEKLADTPYPPGVKKLKAEIPLFRIREGDYRIIYTVENDRLLILIARIGHRGNIYRS